MLDKRYVHLAARQHGLLTTHQLGLTRQGVAHRVKAGLLFRRYRGVYSLLPELTREGEWLAAVFAAGEGAALAALNGAVLYGPSRFQPHGITVAVPRRRRSQGFKLIVGLDPRDIRVRDRIPVTSFERVLIDVPLAPEQCANLIHQGAVRRRFSVAATRALIARTPGRHGRLERAIAMHLAGSAGTRSDLEDRFMRLVRAARIPEPVINTHIHGVEVDFRWGRFCVEVDGRNHLRPATQAKDEANVAILHSYGLELARFTEAAIDRESRAVLDRLARGIADRHGSRT